MLSKALVSPIALAFGLALTGAAAAQTMIGDQEVSDADLAAVQEHCDDLALAASTAPSGAEPTVEVDESATVGVELSTITIQQCIDAGLVAGPVPGLTPSVDSNADDSVGPTSPGDDSDDSQDGEDSNQ